MTLYEINHEIQALIENSVDEDGCINEEAFEALENLQLAREEKIRNYGLVIKNLRADVEGYKREKMDFAKKQKIAENQLEWVEKQLAKNVGDDEKFKWTEVEIGHRKSEQVKAVEGLDITKLPKEFWKYGDPELKKTEIKKFYKEHPDEKIEGVWVEKINNVTVK